MSDKENNGAQNIDGVLEQLRRSYSADSESSLDNTVSDEAVSENVSGDELQARLKTQFLNDNAKSTEENRDEYLIDEDFLRDAYSDEEDAFDNEIITEEITEDSEYGFGEEHQEIEKEDKEDALEEENAQENETIEEEPFDQGSQKEEFEEEAQETQEGLQEIQEEEYNEALEEIYEETQDQEIQEIDSENLQLNEETGEIIEDDLPWDDEEIGGAPLTGSDVEALFEDDGESFEWTEDTRTDAEKAEDNYVKAFYRSNERDPYENIPFKDRISENAPTVDSLEQELYEHEDFSLEEFAEAESIPLTLDDEEELPENVMETVEEDEPQALGDVSELDRSDLALLLEFGYEAEILKNVSDDDIEKLSNEELIDSIESESPDEEIVEEEPEKSESNEVAFEKAKKKLKAQYEDYRKKRGGALLKLIISAVIAVVLFFYEAIPTFGVEFGGIFNRDDYFFAYVLFGLQILILTAIPMVKSIIESFKKFLTRGIDGYLIAGVAVIVTAIYDFIVLFEKTDVPPTFHFCAAIVIILAELASFMKISAEIRNYE
ncbi:MAG: hypothetical protein J6U68_02350 [Clostridia bacterium]|nr:hypothetical protein [Clostridia bacterium]